MMDVSDLAPATYPLVLLGVGGLIAVVVWVPLAMRRLPLTLPIICIALGAGFFTLISSQDAPLPISFPVLTERLTEFVVIVALMGAGLKIDRPFSLPRWGTTWRLLAVTMPLSIAAITILGHWALGLSVATALLLGACLAPTDPVLAADVQVGPPKAGAEDEVRFGLTSEAGLNDGFAFPFVHLALILGALSTAGDSWLLDWAAFYVAWKIGAGLLVGWLIGLAFGWVTFKVPAPNNLASTGDGMIAIAATLVSYGVAEALQGYGFLAVFVAALAFRHAHRHHDFHREMHDFAEQIERLVMMALLLLFGGAIVTGLFDALHWVDAGFALAVLLVVRPVAGRIALAGMSASAAEKLTLAFFGIRGVGSFYYVAYANNHSSLEAPERLWAIVGLIVLLSILMHGLTVTPVMRKLDRHHGRDPDEGVATPDRMLRTSSVTDRPGQGSGQGWKAEGQV